MTFHNTPYHPHLFSHATPDCCRLIDYWRLALVHGEDILFYLLDTTEANLLTQSRKFAPSYFLHLAVSPF